MALKVIESLRIFQETKNHGPAKAPERRTGREVRASIRVDGTNDRHGVAKPEVGARAIYWAAHHSRREIYAGWPTVEAIVGNKLAPGLLDRYLGRTGFDSQQTSEAADPNRPNNLWEPVKGDHGAHGAFDCQAHETSVELQASLSRRWIGAGIAAIAAAVLLASRRG